MKKVFLTKSSQATQKLGEEFAKQLKTGEVILLYGNLGAGKTTFVQGFAKGLGIKKRIISSTFIIVRSYEISNSEYLYHVDLYRIENEKHIGGLGLLEIMENPDNIVIIEWPERLGSLKPKKRTEIHFELIGENERKVSINKYE